MQTNKICTFKFPRREGQLLINLLNDGDVTGYENEEITKVRSFIMKNRLHSFVESKDCEDNALECTFLTDDAGTIFAEHIYILYGGKVRELYDKYGLLPYNHYDGPDYRNTFHTFKTENEKNAFLINTDNRESQPSVFTVVHNLENKMNIWWRSIPERLRMTFSVLPSPGQFWKKLDITTRINIYNYCILKENNLPFSEDEENNLLSETVCELADLALEMIYNKPVEDMCDKGGCFFGKYQDEFNRLYDDIENTIRNISFDE